MHEADEIKDRRFAHCLLHNATLEPLASGFRWLELYLNFRGAQWP